MSKLRCQKQLSIENEEQCRLIYPNRKKSKWAYAKLSAITAKPLWVSLLMPFAICSNTVGCKIHFLDRVKQGCILVGLWFFLITTSYPDPSEIWTFLHIPNFATVKGLSRLASLTWLPCSYTKVYLPRFLSAHAHWHHWVPCKRRQLQVASQKQPKQNKTKISSAIVHVRHTG